ncbi:MAG: hypothetical protein EAZ51_04010 [Sphingobacteriales bacterium]|nr:MAG: hypothetical protein EAZ64_03785 [Sphingobacteriales bacterium]TAF81544.1 MAG: hypothetical protein EAZ51_04010 [Sphingobacteriales bacterium]
MQLYKPFQKFTFDNKHCFLSGHQVLNTPKITVFPAWLIQQYNLLDRPFKMLDERMLSYADIQIPVCEATKKYLDTLELNLHTALQQGYQGLKNISEIQLFQWAGKIVYGIIFNELQAAIKQNHASADGFNMSQGLIHKFAHLHSMLQSITQPIEFEDFKPYSIFLFQVNNPTNEFTYRDEINTLTFSLRMYNFGLIINLQDNGLNRNYHQAILNKIEGKTLHPIQFEELSAKVFYSAYLFNRLPQYHIIPTNTHVFISAMPLQGMSNKPIFDEWQPKVYAQVLENFWKRWQILLLQIIKNPQLPISYLFDDEDKFVEYEKVKAPIVA